MTRTLSTDNCTENGITIESRSGSVTSSTCLTYSPCITSIQVNENWEYTQTGSITGSDPGTELDLKTGVRQVGLGRGLGLRVGVVLR